MLSAGKVTAVMTANRRMDGLKATCGLTACTPGSAPGPTLSNEYGRTLPFNHFLHDKLSGTCVVDVCIRSYWLVVILYWTTAGQDVVNQLFVKRSLTRTEVDVAEWTLDACDSCCCCCIGRI